MIALFLHVQGVLSFLILIGIFIRGTEGANLTTYSTTNCTGLAATVTVIPATGVCVTVPAIWTNMNNSTLVYSNIILWKCYLDTLQYQLYENSGCTGNSLLISSNSLVCTGSTASLMVNGTFSFNCANTLQPPQPPPSPPPFPSPSPAPPAPPSPPPVPPTPPPHPPNPPKHASKITPSLMTVWITTIFVSLLASVY